MGRCPLDITGLFGVDLIVSNDHPGHKAARTARFTGVPWHRRQFYLGQNAMHSVPQQAMRSEVAADLRTVFNAPTADRFLAGLQFVPGDGSKKNQTQIES